MAPRFESFEEFWPYYLEQHKKPLTKKMHFLATSVALFCLTLGVLFLDPRVAIAGAVFAYGVAWISHFFVEKNKPATFKFPLWSLRADLRLWAELLKKGSGKS